MLLSQKKVSSVIGVCNISFTCEIYTWTSYTCKDDIVYT